MALEQRLGQLFDHPSELHLVNAAEQIRTAQATDTTTATMDALTFLRLRAMQHDTEAKTKLSTIYAEGKENVIAPDQDEADMWSRSVFDKQLSQAMALCVPELLLVAETEPSAITSPSTIELILGGVAPQRPCLCYLAGLLLTKGIGGAQDIDRGIALFEVAAQHHQADAAYELGRFYSDRYSYSRPDTALSLKWYQCAFEAGDMRALVDLAYGFSEGDQHQAPRDDARAFEYASKGAELDDKYCQYILGHLYLKGRGTAQNSTEAVRWLSASADQGFAVALEEMTAVYMTGAQDIPQDYTKAHAWSLKGASCAAYCQTSLGDLYRNGWSVARDYQKAFQYYQTAATQPDAAHYYAQHMLGEM
ncbi:hypothetical protein BDF14DRAFT_1743789 [Spinellus fusiger]|nr:hypothetical protein BDF14DRAFT_1743789 [Spinellus fusiger]